MNSNKTPYQLDQDKAQNTRVLVIALGDKYSGELSLSRTDCDFCINDKAGECIDSLSLKSLTHNNLHELYTAYLDLEDMDEDSALEELIDDNIAESLYNIEVYLDSTYSLKPETLAPHREEISKIMRSHIISCV